MALKKTYTLEDSDGNVIARDVQEKAQAIHVASIRNAAVYEITWCVASNEKVADFR